MTQSYRRQNFTSNFSYDAWRLSATQSRKTSRNEEFDPVPQSQSSMALPSSALAALKTQQKEKNYHPFVVVGSCNEIDGLTTSSLTKKLSISTHSVDKISKYREQIRFSPSLSIRKKEFLSLEDGLYNKCMSPNSQGR